MERSSKPPLGDFPSIGGRGRIDGDTYLTKPVVPSETAGFVGSLNPFYIAAPSKGAAKSIVRSCY